MYAEPEWSQATSQSGTIEVLKDGKIIEKIPISAGSKFLSVGRLPENDISLEHESISRKHAIIQFGPRNTAFIYDLGSTHGTFLNKKRIPSSQFIKIASGNAVIHFGASTRLFVLHLDETTDEEVVSDSKQLKSPRVIVTEFFSAHSIPFKSIISSRSDEGCFICSCDFSEYISIDSSEPSRISSSGTTKKEALSNFYEDCYNFILRVGLIDAVQSYDVSDSTDDSSEDDFHTQYKSVPKTIKSNSEALSEKQIISLRDRFKAEVEDIQHEIENLEMKLTALEHEIVDDLDVYVQDLKKTELRADIEKCNSKHAAAKIELLKYENILKLIGSKELIESIQSSDFQNVIKRDEATAKERPFIDHVIISNKKKTKNSLLNGPVLPIEENVEADSDTGIVDFEDSTIHEEQMDLNTLKRKYGY